MATAFSTAPPSFLGDDGTDVLMRRPLLTDEEEIDPNLFPGTQGRPRLWGDLPTVSSGPAAKAAAVSSAVSPVPPPQPDPGPGAGYQDAMSKLEGVYADRPQMQQPKWWQRAAGAAAGFGAGWSNAASRTRHPIDIGAMREDILEPGYNQKLAEWQSRVAPAQAQAEIEGQKQGAWWKNAQLQAQAQYLKAHADYMEGLGRGAYVDVTPEMETATGGVFKVGMKIPGTTATEIARINAGKYEKPEKTMTVTDPDLAKRIGVPAGTDVPVSIYQQALKPVPPEKPLVIPPGAAYFDPATNRPVYTNPREFAPEKAHPQAFGAIETRKNTRLLQAEGEARKALAAAGNDDETRARIMAGLDNTKQQIQNDYENETNAAGGSASHYEYPTRQPGGAPAPAAAPTPAPAPVASAPHPAAAKPKYTEAQVRAAAAAKGKDPDAAVAMARLKNLIP